MFNLFTHSVFRMSGCALGIGLLALAPKASAQTPLDAILMQPGEVCSGLTYEFSSFDEYWEGTTLRTNETVNVVNRDYVELMSAVGLIKHHNLLVSLPYVSTYSTDPTGGRLEGASGISDLSLFLKSEWLYKSMGKGNLSALTTVGFMTPVSNYNADYRPYSIGFGANELSLRAILEYEFNSGLYVRAMGGHLWRGQAEVDRDSYYQDGEIYYTNMMDVPNAWHYQVVVGQWFFNHGLKVQAQYTALNSTSGDDIRAYAKPQPTNEVDAGQVGAFAQVYLNKPAGLGAIAYFNTTVSGRNVGKSTHYGVGLTYIINFSGKPSLPKSETE
jgi:hypothetical protein